PMACRPLAPALAAIALVLALTMPAFGSAPEAGHWEELGEDGRVWVPAIATLGYLPPGDLLSFHNASEARAALLAAEAARPDLVFVTQIGTSVQGRPILMATLTGPGDATGRTRLLFDGAHHGDEVIASEILVRFVQRVVAEYDTNATMRSDLSQVVVDVVPQVNPDGIDFVPQCTNYAMCRKNAHGVDLNRNYEAHWGEPGASGNPSDPTYRGPAPLSEPESTAIAALMDLHDYALYASLHSGAEMILWPYGWTTTPPPEQAVYNTLGSQLSAVTGAPHGQVSRILYTVSGDSMDQAYVAADGWRALALSPETYKGSGTATDWWYLFNPPESQIPAVVARWERFLWHMVAVAPQYAPAMLTAPSILEAGPGEGVLSVLLSAPSARPFQGASLRFEAGSAPVTVTSANPQPVSGPGTYGTTMLPNRGGTYGSTLHLEAGPAGKVSREVTLELVQLGLEAAVDQATLGPTDTGTFAVTVNPGPFEAITGTLTVRVQPEGTVMGSASVSLLQGETHSLVGSFSPEGLARGPHLLEATLVYTAHLEGGMAPGLAKATDAFTIIRPEVTLTKSFLPVSKAGEPLKVTSTYRSTGDVPAEGLVVRERVPAGYTYHVRDGPVPVPTDPLGRPSVPEVVTREDGSVDLVWRFGDLAPGQTRFVQYRLLPLVPGTAALSSAWQYTTSCCAHPATYSEAAHPAHVTRLS
ncbi:MAG TPA: M14 family zinc carboxypeptidase, partial [Candidatus Thermoplasmatota archaeon]|nr:M14 family zinc carboxypeptidase [Candidatus Thermoplasmatota archaeon]